MGGGGEVTADLALGSWKGLRAVAEDPVLRGQHGQVRQIARPVFARDQARI